jgi:phosphatidylserine decarboxylase
VRRCPRGDPISERRIACDAYLNKGDEMGWFQHGSTIVVFAPREFSLCGHVREGERIRVG